MEKDTKPFDICVVCALPEETKAFLQVVQQQSKNPLKQGTSPRYHSDYRSIILKNNKGEPLTLHISCPPRYGPQEMMLHLSHVLEEWQPRFAIMTGICAGDSQHVQLGDLVIAERTFTYDNGKFSLDSEERRVHLHDTFTYQPNANVLQFLTLFDGWEPLISELKRSLSSSGQYKTTCHIKAMASGSAVRADAPFKDVQTLVRGTVAIDMEGAAFGNVMSHHPQIHWLVVKGVCDFADQAKNDTYHEYAAYASALYALSFVQAYVTQERLPRQNDSLSPSRAGPSEIKYYFVSYADPDKDLVERLKEDLEKQDFKVYMRDKIPGGANVRDTVEGQIRQSTAVLYLASPASRRSRYVDHEIELAKEYRRKIIPLWIQGDTSWAKVAAFGYSSIQYIDLRGEKYKDGINKIIQIFNNITGGRGDFMSYLVEDENITYLQEANDTTNMAPNLTKELEMPQDTKRSHRRSGHIDNPYKGLHAFEYDDANCFFGRESLVQKMIQEVKDLFNEERQDSQVPRCIMIKGASGSGKSSVVMAGLLPALEDKRNIPQVNSWFFLDPVKPGDNPMAILAQALKQPFLNKKHAGNSPLERWSRADLRDTLDEPSLHGLNELLQEITDSPDERIVLIIDQFEEIFAPSVNSEQREQFIKLLMATATEPDTPILLLFTLRADFSHRILDDENLHKHLSRHQIEIPPMTREGLRAVIEKPVQPLNVEFDLYLAEDILHEVRQRPESLPLLQFTLKKLFDDRDGLRLTRQSYDNIGGLSGAINKHAEDIYQRKLHTPAHKEEAKKLFTKYFIYIPELYNEPLYFEPSEVIARRRVTAAELQLSDPRLSIRRETIDAFLRGRLLTTSSVVKESTGLENTDVFYEITHEALINAWGQLREWTKENRKDILLIQPLRPRAIQWEQEKDPYKKKNQLLDKPAIQQLKEYRKYNELDHPMENFFKASLDRQTRQKAWLYGGSSLFFIAIVLLALLIFHYIVFPPPNSNFVTRLGDSGLGTLTYAVQNASDRATITFDPRLTGQTIYLTHNVLDINKSIVIDGPPGGINISSDSTGNYIHINTNQNVTIDHLGFINSYTLKNPIILNEGNLTINSSTIYNNKSFGKGGAIRNTGNLLLNSDIIEGNKTSTDGGTIYNLFGTVGINNTIISSNEAYGNGGGIYNLGGSVITLTFGLNEPARTSLEVPLKRKNCNRNVSNAIRMEQVEAAWAFCG